MRRLRIIPLVLLVLAGLLGATLPASATAAPTIPTLVDIRAAHHPGFDRVVFDFDGPLPSTRTVRYVPQVIQDGSGDPVKVQGRAFLEVSLFPTIGHTEDGRSRTYGPARRSFTTHNVVEVVNSGDFEAVVSFGIGLASKQPYKVFTLTNPSRLVIDIEHADRTVWVKDYFQDRNRYAAGTEPYVKYVWRRVPPPAVATGALERLFAGPTQAERAGGLRFVGSGATGFSHLSVSDRVARVRLTGGCDSGGSTFTVADLIMPTLRQFPNVDWVKIYDPSGRTQAPTGHSDSIPTCLEP